MTFSHFALAAGLAAAACLTPAWAAKAPSPSAPAGPAKLTELVVFDQVTGHGKQAVAGSTLTIHYTGWLYAPRAPRQRGSKFDTSVDGKPFTFKQGVGTVIKGWEQGVIGMKAGGKRTLLVPPSLGFGKDGLGPVPSTASVVFDIELLDVK